MTNKILNEKNIAKLKERKKNKSVSHDCNRTIFLVHAMIHSSNSHSVFWRVFFFFLSSLRLFYFHLFFPKIWNSSNWHLLLGNGYSKDLGGTLKRWRNVMSGDKHEVKWHYGMLLMALSGGRKIFEVCATERQFVLVLTRHMGKPDILPASILPSPQSLIFLSFYLPVQ